MGLTLREAMTLADPLRRAKVVAGAQGLDKVVESVNVMEVPDILQWVRPGELLVTTMYPLRDDAAAIESLIPRLAEKGLVGLAVTPLSYIDQIPQCMIEAADRLGFPLIELPPKVTFIDIIQPITSKILDIQGNELLESEHIHQQFIDLVLSGGGYTEIAQGIAERVGCSVSIVDRFRRILGHAQVDRNPASEKEFISEDGSDEIYLNDRYKPVLVETLSRSEARRMHLAGPDGPIDHIVCLVKAGDLILGEILVWGPLLRALEPMDLIAIQHGSTVAALKMMEARSRSEVQQRFQNEILEGLLSDQADTRERAVYLAGDAGRPLNPPFAIILVEPDLPWGTVLAKAGTREQSSIISSLHLARRYIGIVEPSAAFWSQGPRLVVFFPLGAGHLEDAKASLRRELPRICERIKEDNNPYTVSMGVSSIVSDLSGFAAAYKCARQSLMIGRALQERSSSTVTHYEELGLFRIIPFAGERPNLVRFCEDTIGSLLRYDRENGTELVKTLRVFLEHNGSLTETAKALYVHYNTLRYRLDRIREILGDVLTDPRLRLAVEVALQLDPVVSRSLSHQDPPPPD